MKEDTKNSKILVINEFLDVFLDEVLGLPPVWGFDFKIIEIKNSINF